MNRKGEWGQNLPPKLTLEEEQERTGVKRTRQRERVDGEKEQKGRKEKRRCHPDGKETERREEPEDPGEGTSGMERKGRKGTGKKENSEKKENRGPNSSKAENRERQKSIKEMLALINVRGKRRECKTGPDISCIVVSQRAGNKFSVGQNKSNISEIYDNTRSDTKISEQNNAIIKQITVQTRGRVR